MSIREPIGDDYYLIRGQDRSDYLLISAHGATMRTSFHVPRWTQLHFYAPRGKYLVMGMSKFQLGAKVEEIIGSGSTSPDYSISKYQGKKHGAAGETYDTLGQLVDRTRTKIAEPRPSMPDISPEQRAVLGEKQIQLLEEGLKAQIREYEYLIPFDFLTVRNRKPWNPFYAGPTLRKALQELEKADRKYTYIFCSFCRGIGWFNRTHTVGTY